MGQRAGLVGEVDYALRHGWQPERRGGTFVLSEHEHAAGFTLPGFLLTDRLRTPESADPTARVITARAGPDWRPGGD